MQKRNKQVTALTVLSIIYALYGLVLIASATYSTGSLSNVIIQSVAIIIGLVLMFMLKAIDYEILLHLSKIIYVLFNLFLILVLIIGTGRAETGTNGWIALGPVNIQPSEFAKLAFIILESTYLSRIEDHDDLKQYIMPAIIFAIFFKFFSVFLWFFSFFDKKSANR